MIDKDFSSKPADLISLPDGSLTLQDSQTGEYYHNKAGAFEEAWYQYVLPSNLPALMRQTNNIRILDACFGLGYNTWCILKQVLRLAPSLWPDGGSVKVWAIEQDVSLLKFYPHILDLEAFKSLMPFCVLREHNVYYQTQKEGLLQTVKILSQTQNNVHLSVTFVAMSLRWTDGDWPNLVNAISQDGNPVGGHLVFHDPFSPRKMPALWSLEIFQQYFDWLKPNAQKSETGRLLTYSSANAVRGALIQSGFQIFQTTPLGAKTRGGLCGVALTESYFGTEALGEGIFPFPESTIQNLKGIGGIPYRDLSSEMTPCAILKARDAEQNAYLPNV